MATSNTLLFNANIRHQIYLLRFAGGSRDKYFNQIQKAQKTLLSELGKVEVAQLTKTQYSQFIGKLESRIDEIYRGAETQLLKELEKFNEFESDFQLKQLKSSVKPSAKLTSLSLQKQKDIIFDNVLEFSPTDKFSIKDALKDFSSKKRNQLLGIVRDGINNGEPIPEISNVIQSNIGRLQKRQVSTLVRTIVNHSAHEVRKGLYQENRDVVQKVKWVSTLDRRTSSECQALDGQVFEIDSGHPEPGFHWGCRSTLSPVINPKYNLLKDAKRTRMQRGVSGKSSLADHQNYNSWLKSQPADFQDEILGKAKGKLFRNGGLNVQDFVDSNYRPYSLEELVQIEEDAAIKANLIDK